MVLMNYRLWLFNIDWGFVISFIGAVVMNFHRMLGIPENCGRPKTEGSPPSAGPPMTTAPICQILSQFSLPSAVGLC